MKELTGRQKQTLQFIEHYIEENGFPPSIKEIGTYLGIGSLRGTTTHLDALERKGYIKRGNTPRSTQILKPTVEMVRIRKEDFEELKRILYSFSPDATNNLPGMLRCYQSNDKISFLIHELLKAEGSPAKVGEK